MNKRLVSIALVSLGVSAACAVLVALTSATDWVDGDYRSWAGTTQSCAVMPSAKTAGASEPRIVDLEWAGSDAVKIKIPARVHYQPGPKPQASVSGDAELVSHVRLRDGALEWDTVDDCFPAGDLVVRLTGPAVTAWTLNGSAELDLSDIKQDVLRIAMHGSGKGVVGRQNSSPPPAMGRLQAGMFWLALAYCAHTAGGSETRRKAASSAGGGSRPV